MQAVLKGASYELVHCNNVKRTKKRHASDLSPYPAKLIPFKPVDGVDTRYGQIFKPISAQPFKEAVEATMSNSIQRAELTLEFEIINRIMSSWLSTVRWAELDRVLPL